MRSFLPAYVLPILPVLVLLLVTPSACRRQPAAQDEVEAQFVGARPEEARGLTGLTGPGAQRLPRLRVDWRQYVTRGAALGRGSYGEVHRYEVTSVDGCAQLSMVLKELTAPQAAEGSSALATTLLREWVARTASEVTAMEEVMDSPHVVRIYAFDDGARSASIMMEEVAGGSLNESMELLWRQSPRERLTYALRTLEQLLLAVADLQRAALVHRDLKPENVLLTESILSDSCRVKVADFGFACSVDSGRGGVIRCIDDQDISGTPVFMAPERYSRDWQEWEKIDIFSVGVIFHEMVCGTHLERLVTFYNQTGCEFQLRGDYSEHDEETIEVMLRALLWPDAFKRMSAGAALAETSEALRTREAGGREEATLAHAGSLPEFLRADVARDGCVGGACREEARIEEGRNEARARSDSVLLQASSDVASAVAGSAARMAAARDSAASGFMPSVAGTASLRVSPRRRRRG